MAGQSQGAQAQLKLDATVCEFLSMDPGVTHNLIDNGERALGRGRSNNAARVESGLIRVRPKVTLNPSITELAAVIDYITGGASGTLAETLGTFPIVMDLVASVLTLADCKVDKAIFKGSKGLPVELTLECIGTTETIGAGGTFGAGSVPTDKFYVLHQGVLTLQAGAHLFDRFALVVDNHLEDEFNNSQTVTDVAARDRTVLFACGTPYTSDEATLYSTPAGSPDGAAGSLVFTSGVDTLTFTMGNLKSVAKAPEVMGKRAIRLPLNYKSYKTGATDELAIT